ncbi:MAG: ATPase [Acidobacteria bacterium]|nr:ATPase [Acidobacteriota bacterium]
MVKDIESDENGPELYLGIDGGQSHTEAVIADRHGRVLARGTGGPSNHAEMPGGRERLRAAVTDSVGIALRAAGLASIDETVFAAAHCGMTGGAIYKEEIIALILRAERLTVGHDAPTALYGATAGRPGVIVIAGTGSVVFGRRETGETARAGGLGYLFSDEGSGFWLAAEAIRLAIKEQDGLLPAAGILEIVLEFFERRAIRELTDDFYNGRVSRDEIAALARRVHEAAAAGNETLRRRIADGAGALAEGVAAVAAKLGFDAEFPVSGVGGMFRAPLMNRYFESALAEIVPRARVLKPRFGAALGAVLFAYEQAGIEISGELLRNLDNTAIK